MRESAVKDAVKRLLRQRRAYYYMPVPNGMGAASVDFFVNYKGRFIGVETKRPGINRITPRQETVLEEIVEAGGWRVVENDCACVSLRKVLDEIDAL